LDIWPKLYVIAIYFYLDLDLLAEIQEWGKNISILTKERVGQTRVFLNGKAIECRLRECNMGNFVADAMVYVVQTLLFESPSKNNMDCFYLKV